MIFFVQYIYHFLHFQILLTMKSSLLFVFVFAIHSMCTFGTAPLAPHKLVEVNAGSDVVISLTGYDLDGDKLEVTITSLPSSGTLYQLSQVYSTHGYEPKLGTQITSAGTKVTGSKNRIVYVRPSVDAVNYDKWATFTYSVSDGPSVSESGTVTLVPPTGVLVGSNFLLGDEQWKITGNKAAMGVVTYEAGSRGLLNHYIHGTDDLLNIYKASGDDAALWYFTAPSPFLGNQGIAYGGQLTFTLSAHAGDFSSGNMNSNVHLVEMHCAKCAVNTGVTISFPLSAVSGGFAGSDKTFSLVLNEKSGWLKDPENTLKTWSAPTKCEFIELLSGLTRLKILGDFTKWYESVSIDNVAFVNMKQQLPICAQGSADASVCSC
mmetsp:Transcript_14714/g.18816  ORF Transcript_14714/g.18816 Transcript_14714/m.18816 type:complete len:377 (-) Transcript_14714:136-1266(-)